MNTLKRQDRGFVLVGVVMFMLALTILALSLFTLSTYEYGFLGDSVDKAQAFYSAVGGMQRAAFALAKVESLSAVKRDLPMENVIYARALQGTDSLGAVISDSNVVVRVTARVRANSSVPETVTVQGTYRLNSLPLAYKYLMTLFSPDTSIRLENRDNTLRGIGGTPGHANQQWGIWLGDDGNGGQSHPARLWLNNPNTRSLTRSGGQGDTIAVRGTPTVTRPRAPDPPIDSFMSTYFATAAGPRLPGASHDYHLDAGNGQWGFFKNAYTGGAYSLKDTLDDGNLSVAVGGKCVWMFDHGVRFKNKVMMKRSTQPGTSALVIVAKKCSDPADTSAAIWLENGIDFQNNGTNNYVAVILVTDGRVRIESHGTAADPVGSTKMPYITIFAHDVVLQNPALWGGNYKMQLFHDITASEDNVGGLIDQLSDLGLLPGVQRAANDRISMTPGSWIQLR